MQWSQSNKVMSLGDIHLRTIVIGLRPMSPFIWTVLASKSMASPMMSDVLLLSPHCGILSPQSSYMLLDNSVVDGHIAG